MANPKMNLIPVLIIPGFMSSVLTIEESTLEPSWKGKRLWLNIETLGFSAMRVGGALRRNEDIRSTRLLHAGDNNKNREPADHSIEELHRRYLKEAECKSKWVEHMRLSSDMVTERKGVVVRALPGTAGVDYLSGGVLTESMSYVFGPVLKLLRSVGYQDGINLDAAPYDWRIPPCELESRDKYFTNTMRTIERMYNANGETPVVILCHSMGCKTAHYLFNFALHLMGAEEGGKWIEKYIASYVPVGAPHVGAPASVRSIMDGDKMGLDAFLNDTEGLIMGRSLGSAPWLFPIDQIDFLTLPTSSAFVLQSGEIEAFPPVSPPPKSPLPTSLVRTESALRITVPFQRLCVKSFLQKRGLLPPQELRLAIQLGKDLTLRTEYVNILENDVFMSFNNETWIVSCPSDFQKTYKQFPYLRVSIETPGALSIKEEPGVCDFDLKWPIRCILCLMKWIFCCPCALIGFVISGAKMGVNAATAALGSYTTIGESEMISGRLFLHNNNNNDIDTEDCGGKMLNITASLKTNTTNFLFWRSTTSEVLTLKVGWEAQLVPNKKTESSPLFQKAQQYSCCDTNHLMIAEGMSNAIRLMKEVYEADPVGPLSLSSWHPPPVKKVISIYGINIPTEVAAVYRRNPVVYFPSSITEETSDNLRFQPTFILDKEAILTKSTSKTHLIDKGLIRETSKTPQTIVTMDRSIVIENKSGDGTVPYWSLQFCRTWQGKGMAQCDVTVHEIDSVEHRSILNDSKFHNILLELLGVAR